MEDIARRAGQALASLLVVAGTVAAGGIVQDRDGDGLSDFHERHKYGTDPARADSDGDGIPDGDWDERREWAYSVRAIVQVMRPVTPEWLCDDFQDARVLDETEEYVELEVVLYPFSSANEAIAGDPRWRERVAADPELARWTEPGPTANWDGELAHELEAALAADGIDARALDDAELVRAAARWLLAHAPNEDGFTTYSATFEDGKARVASALEESVAAELAKVGRSLEEQWRGELFAKGMFELGRRGSCSSTSIYLTGCLRALGIPTRTVISIPLVDASDEREMDLVRRSLRHPRVRRVALAGLTPLKGSWASHAFNEVFVGGRWRRLNYENLGQEILDAGLFGLTTHVATLRDWSEGGFAATWGLRAARGTRDDAFGGPNPYSTVALSDRFGEHSGIDPAALPEEEHRLLTISKLYWWSSPERDAVVTMRLDDPATAGHVLAHVEEHFPGGGTAQYEAFWHEVDRAFVLRAAEREDVPVRAERGYWVNEGRGLREFYLRLEPAELARMSPGVAYSLVPRNAVEERRWAVADGVRLVRAEPGPESRSGCGAGEVPDELVVDRVVWSDGPDSPAPGFLEGPPVLLLRVGAAADFPCHKRFTELADRRFFLEAAGRPPLGVGADTGGLTVAGESWAIVRLGSGDWRDLVPGVAYRLRARNDVEGRAWTLAADAVPAR